MVLGTQSDPSEDLQTRTVGLRKRLPKAVSVVPRARFQKAKPNVPNFKRANPGSVSKQEKVKDASQKNDVDSAEAKSKIHLETPKEHPDTAAENATEEFCRAVGITSSAISITAESSSGDDETYIPPDSCKNTSTESNYEKDYISSNSLSKDTSGLNTSTDSVDTSKNCPSTTVSKTTFPESSKELDATGISLPVSQTNTDFDSAPVRRKSNEGTKKTLTSAVNSSANSQTDERNSVTNPTSVTTDRSSKYPYLSSILSKKRAEPKKEVHQKRRYKKGDAAPERSKMTMNDLIYWNPTSDTGMKYDNPSTSVVLSLNELEEEEDVDLAPAPEENEDDAYDSVPKLVLVDGKINIDQRSLIVSRKRAPEPPITQVLGNAETKYTSYRKHPLTKPWTDEETVNFYKALTLVGTDFGLMENMFPGRTRRELKMKFKREEKYHIEFVNSAMYDYPLTFDSESLKEHFEELMSDRQNDKEIANNKTRLSKKKQNGKKNVANDETSPPNKTSKIKVEKKSNAKRKKKVQPDCERDEVETDPLNDAEELHVEKRAEPNARRRKRVQSDNDNDEVENDPPYDAEELHVEKKTKPGSKKRRKALSDSDSESDQRDSFNDIDKSNVIRSKRKRKEKKFPDCYVDADDLEDLDMLILNGSEPSNSTEDNITSENHYCPGSNLDFTNFENTDLMELNTNIENREARLDQIDGNIEIIQDIAQYSEMEIIENAAQYCEISEDHSDFEAEHAKNNVTPPKILHQKIKVDPACPNRVGKKTSKVASNVRQLAILPTNGTESDASVIENVMANEVVTSDEIASKSKKKDNKPSRQKVVTTRQKISKGVSNLVQPSSLNYTPVDDCISNHQLTPKNCTRTYSKSSMKTPISQNTLVTSLQIPVLTPEHSNMLHTSLNMSNCQQLAIPLTPEPNKASNPILTSLNMAHPLAIPLMHESNEASNPVVFFTKSPNTDNVLHMFMYNNTVT